MEENLRIGRVPMNNLRCMLLMERIDRIRNERIRGLCNAKKGVNEIVSENVLKWYGHVRKVEKS